MKLQRARGTQDILADEAIPLSSLKRQLTAIFEQYGFVPVDTPAIERVDTLSAKYAGGSEILKEMFKVTDQGDRELALRYDHTVPLARLVGMNPQLKKPFKRYVIDKVWRDGPISLGRFREFLQCDVDTIGVIGIEAEVELMLLAARVMNTFGLTYRIRYNDRRLLEALMGAYDIKNTTAAMVAIDKADKLSRADLVKELEQVDTRLVELWQALQDSQDPLAFVKEKTDAKEAIDAAERIVTATPVNLDLTLVRGLAYYTSSVFEIVLEEGAVKSSVGGGGRYDKMIGDFLGSDTLVPAVGISFGLSRLLTALIESGKLERKASVASALIIGMGKDVFSECLKLAEELRDAGLNVEVDLAGRNSGKNMKYADSQGIPFVLIIGEDELANGTVTVKDMASGEQKNVKREDVASTLRG